MPTSITLKNIPDNVYACLRAAAAANRRSLNSEAIVCLEAVLLPSAVSVSERLDRAQALRNALPHTHYRTADIDAFKRAGRA